MEMPQLELTPPAKSRLASRLEIFKNYFDENKQIDVSAAWAVAIFLAIVLWRIFATIRLYDQGFNSVSADDFGRMIDAANWSKQPYGLWYGPWLPFHSYFFGSILRLHWDLLWMPRVIMVVLGICNLFVVYLLTLRLFRNRLAGLVAAFALSLNPAHLWLSSTPLTELITHALILLAILFLVIYIQDAKVIWVFFSAIVFAIATGFRFEAWLFTAIFSVIVTVFVGRRIIRKEQSLKQSLIPIISACLPWAFPLMWLLGNHIYTGDAFFFLSFVRDYKATHYGNNIIPEVYGELFLRLDPYLVRASAFAIAWATIIRGFSKGKLAYLLMAVVPASVFLWMGGGQSEPMGNYIRYYGPFLFYLYPYLGIFLIGLVSYVPFPKWLKYVIIVIVCLLSVSPQMKNADNYFIDPSAGGVKIGQRIEYFLDQMPKDKQSALVQREYWLYLAIQTGANDDGKLIFDTPLNKTTRDTTSLLLTQHEQWLACVEEFDVGLLVYRNEQAAALLSDSFGLFSVEDVNGYKFFLVPENFTEAHKTSSGITCPLVPELPFNLFEVN